MTRGGAEREEIGFLSNGYIEPHLSRFLSDTKMRVRERRLKIARNKGVVNENTKINFNGEEQFIPSTSILTDHSHSSCPYVKRGTNKSEEELEMYREAAALRSNQFIAEKRVNERIKEQSINREKDIMLAETERKYRTYKTRACGVIGSLGDSHTTGSPLALYIKKRWRDKQKRSYNRHLEFSETMLFRDEKKVIDGQDVEPLSKKDPDFSFSDHGMSCNIPLLKHSQIRTPNKINKFTKSTQEEEGDSPSRKNETNHTTEKEEQYPKGIGNFREEIGKNITTKDVVNDDTVKSRNIKHSNWKLPRLPEPIKLETRDYYMKKVSKNND